MIKLIPLLVTVLFIASCTVKNPSGLTRSEQQGLEAKAAQNAQCVFEDQFACSHIIENRTVFSRFFAPPGIGKMDENEKLRGQGITTRYVVKAASSIQQCTRTSDKAILLLKNLEISGEPFQVFGTSPLSDQSKCYLAREAS